jgi:chromosome segregation ATPase
MKATYCSRIIELENSLEEQKRLEADLRGTIKELESKARVLSEELRKTEREKKEAESSLRNQREYNESMVQEKDAIREQVEVRLNGEINELLKKLQERQRTTKNLETTLRRRRVLQLVQRQSLFRRIKKLDEKNKKVEAELKHANSDKGNVGSARYIRMKKYLAVTVTVAVAGAGWWFFS